MPERVWERADGRKAPGAGTDGRVWERASEPGKVSEEPESPSLAEGFADQPLGERAKRSVQNVIGSVSSMAGAASDVGLMIPGSVLFGFGSAIGDVVGSLKDSRQGTAEEQSKRIAQFGSEFGEKADFLGGKGSELYNRLTSKLTGQTIEQARQTPVHQGMNAVSNFVRNLSKWGEVKTKGIVPSELFEQLANAILPKAIEGGLKGARWGTNKLAGKKGDVKGVGEDSETPPNNFSSFWINTNFTSFIHSHLFKISCWWGTLS